MNQFSIHFPFLRPPPGLPISIGNFHSSLVIPANAKVTGVNPQSTSGGTFKHVPANFAPLINGAAAAVLKPAPVQQMLPPSNATVVSQQSTKQSNHHKSRQSTEGEYQV